VLVAVDNHYDADVVRAIVIALREKGAHVDWLQVDAGPNREFTETDEIDVTMRQRPWRDAPRRWEGIPWIEEMAAREGYDLLIHGKGGPIPPTSFRYEQIPWLGRDHFTEELITFPQPLLALVNQRTWDVIWQHGRGGAVRVQDPEGTDFTYSLNEAYYDGSHYGWWPEPRKVYGHLMAHPTPPLVPQADATGVVMGTTSHFNKPFPRIRLELEGGMVQAISGGGEYGDRWKDLLLETRHTQYPSFPHPGLFYLWEVAIGGHPKIQRPHNIHEHASGGAEWERRRAGIIHLGFGTLWRHSDEEWAAERGLWYGHLHVHLLFPTVTVYSRQGEHRVIIDRGHLSALDLPEVRELASHYGDPDLLLSEQWIPRVPGINAPGDYAEYAAEPWKFIYSAR